MAKINQKEYYILKSLDDKWRWITRDSYRDEKEYENVLGGIRVFSKKPFKSPRDDHFGMDGTGMGIDWLYLDRDVFLFIKPYDDKPYSIAELIEEYEEHEFYNYVGWEYCKSEEAEVKKDIEWLKQEIKKIHTLTFDSYEAAVIANNKHFQTKNSEQLAFINKVLEIINQLDEPEVLSQEWIDKNKTSIDRKLDGTPIYKVREELLQNLLVPKQEEVDRAYKDGYEKGKEYTFYKGYLEGLADKEKEPETVADVVSTFWKSFERLKEVMNMEVEEWEE